MKIQSVIVAGCLFLGLSTYSHALTVEEILLLKQNGVSEPTIQAMIASEIQAEANRAAQKSIGVRTIMRAGGQPAIVYSTGGGGDNYHPEERLREERAWEMLRRLIVDVR